jgi:hypothetical protein
MLFHGLHLILKVCLSELLFEQRQGLIQEQMIRLMEKVLNIFELHELMDIE